MLIVQALHEHLHVQHAQEPTPAWTQQQGVRACMFAHMCLLAVRAGSAHLARDVIGVRIRVRGVHVGLAIVFLYGVHTVGNYY